jgi:FkbM family methyltransferase
MVCAFEPSPINLIQLRAAVEDLANVTILPFALGANDAAAKFIQGEDRVGATSRLAYDHDLQRGSQVDVPMRRGDSLLVQGTIPTPNVIKIDTEGAELDVLIGLSGVLSAPELRCLCIEVHFGILTERGFVNAPKQIEALLVAAGFSLRWTDLSHIVAVRVRQ